jgi:predicted phage baseplate assembly protein
MPLELKAPTFDRSFEDIYRELRSRIPRFNPAWTNYNDSDPGITLLQLFAWLTEMTLHRMNDVPRLHYLKFAQLLGLELAGPKPARVRLSFTPKTSEIPATIKARSRFGGQANGEQVVFETIDPLDIIAAPLAAIVVFGDGGLTTIPPADPSAPQPFYPLGRNPAVGSALHLGFKPTPGNLRPFPRKMRFLALRPAADTAGAPQRAGDEDRILEPPVELVWEYRPKRNQNVWERLNVLKDGTVAFTRDGYIDVEGPQQIEAGIDPALATHIADPLFWLRVRLDDKRYLPGRAPRLEHFVANAVDAEHLTTGDPQPFPDLSTGRPDQTRAFPNRPVDPSSVEIETLDEGGRATPWTRRDDFLDSDADDLHYVLEAAAGVVRFGDGEHGLIPPAGHQIMAKAWRYGGGSRGNDISPGAVKTLISQIAGVEKVTNLRSAVGGADEQSIEDFIKRAPADLRASRRAVTAKDFEAIALSIDGVRKARALGGRHPDFPDIEVAGAVTVLVVPDSTDMPPRPSAELVRAVCKVLDGQRMITSEVYVSGPRFIEVRLEARLFAPPDSAFDAVAEAARKRIDEFLSPFNRTFGEDLSPAALYGQLYGSDGQVRSVENLLIYVDGLPHDLGRPIGVPPNAIVFPGSQLIVVRPDRDRITS